MRYSFVTIVFEPEYALWRLQAKSMAKYVDATLVEDIIVICNSRSRAFFRRVEAAVSLYGPLAGKVRVLAGADVAIIPASEGWLSQQVLKLQAARLVGSDRIVILDAKTHFIRSLTESFLTDPEGKAFITGYSYRRHPLRKHLERTLGFFGLDPEGHLDHFPSSAPPFTFYRQLVLDLMAHVERETGVPFADAFLRLGFTEFFLYIGWLLKTEGDITGRYTFHDRHCPTIWEHRVLPEQINKELDRGRVSNSPLLSVHRRAYPKLPRASVDLISDVWSDADLFAAKQGARRFIRRFRRGYFLTFAIETGKRRLKALRS